MPDSARMWMEISFNIAYLFVVWGLVIAMWRRQSDVPPANQPVSSLFIGAFALLALGDTPHLGFRIWAYAQGDLNAVISLFGAELGLVGLGALATAITVTMFYVLVQIAWHRRFQKPYGWFGVILFSAVLVRFALMMPEANQWNEHIPPQPWAVYRNLPLMVQGLGIAYLILRDARAREDKTFAWIGLMIVMSFAFYTPVIFFVQQVPFLGMLMIPKTIAYVAVAFIAYFHFFRRAATAPQMGTLKTA